MPKIYIFLKIGSRFLELFKGFPNTKGSMHVYMKYEIKVKMVLRNSVILITKHHAYYDVDRKNVKTTSITSKQQQQQQYIIITSIFTTLLTLQQLLANDINLKRQSHLQQTTNFAIIYLVFDNNKV